MNASHDDYACATYMQKRCWTPVVDNISIANGYDSAALTPLKYAMEAGAMLGNVRCFQKSSMPISQNME
jgi:hypothetical protein